MKQIILKRIEMHNFRGAKEQITDFNADITTISGRNGLGKSRHADAFIWCLTGKDTQDRTDFEIKTRDIDAETLKKADASVQLTLNIDGQDVKLKRSLVERWETPKGQIEEVFKGNKTVCYFDDVPVSVKDYASRVNEIIGSNIFKILTNPNYFCDILDWKIRRAILSCLVGISNDDAIAKKPELAAVLKEMNGKSEDDFAAWLRAQLAPLKDKPKEIEIRIRQIQEDMPAEQDWTELEKQIANLESEIEEKQILLHDNADESAAFVSKKYELQGEIDKLMREQRELVRKEEDAIQHTFDRANDEYIHQLSQKRDLEDRISRANRRISDIEQSKQHTQSIIDVAVSTKTRLASQYDAIKSGNALCPTCGGKMTDKLAGELLPDIINQIDQQNEIIKNGEDTLLNADNSIQNYKTEITTNEAELAKISGLTAPIKPAVVAETIKGYNDLTQRINEAKERLTDFTATHSNDETDKIKSELANLKDECTDLKVQLANRERRHDFNERILDLNKKAEEIAIQRAALERLQYLFMQLRYVKADILQQRVNAMFTQVQFKMFTTTLDGNIQEACIPLIGGAYYGSANSAAKLNAGLDIINTMCRFYDVCAPIWIDNAEGINHITPTTSQQIRLVVTDEETLTIR